MKEVTRRLIIFTDGKGLYIVGASKLQDLYDQWKEATFDPPEKKVEFVGYEDDGRRTPISITLLWEDVKGMQLEILD